MKKYALLALLLCLALCLPALASAEETAAKPMMDVVWLIDTTGSIGTSRIATIQNQMDGFAAQMTNFNVRYSLVAFGDEANDQTGSGYNFPEETVWLTMGSSHWTDSCETLKSYIAQGEGKLPKYHGGDSPETSTNAIVKAAEWIGRIEGSETWRDGALRQFVLVTDAQPKQKKQGGYKVQGKLVYVYDIQEAIDACLNRDISVSVAAFDNSIRNAYKDLVEKTGGKYQYVGGSTTIAAIGEWISSYPVINLHPARCVEENHPVSIYIVKRQPGAVTGCQYQKKAPTSGSVWEDISSYVYTDHAKTSDAGTRFRIKLCIDGIWRYSNEVTLDVIPAPSIAKDPISVNAEPGANVSFEVTASGGRSPGYELTYQWQKLNGSTWKNIDSATTPKLELKNVQEGDNGSQYRCVVKSYFGTKRESNPATLTVYPKLVITTQPEPTQTAEVGAKVSFTVAATGDVAGYQWQKKNGSGYENITGATGATLQLSGVQETDAGTYRCVVSSGHNTTLASNDAVLTVLSAPAIAQQPESVIVMEGEDASITVAATGDGLKYQWQVYRSGVWMDCIGEESPTLTLSGVTLADDGLTYRCVITSSFGTKVTSDAVTLTVLAKPEPLQTGDASRPLLWLALLGASLLGMVMLRRRLA